METIADSEGRTPLHWAVDRGHLNITELLVSKNANVNAKVICTFIGYQLMLLFVIEGAFILWNVDRDYNPTKIILSKVDKKFTRYKYIIIYHFLPRQPKLGPYERDGVDVTT